MFPVGWKSQSLGKCFILERGRVISKEYIRNNSGIYPVYSSQTTNDGELGRINTFDFEGEYLTWTTDGAHAGQVFLRTGRFSCTNVCGIAKAMNPKEISVNFIVYFLQGKTKKYVSYVGNPKLMNKIFATIPIAYPPLPEQKAIADILQTWDTGIEKTEALIAAKERQFGWLAWRLINKTAIHSEWPVVRLREAIKIITPPKKIQKTDYMDSGQFPIIDQSQNKIVGWTNDKEALVDVIKPLVVFGDHTCIVKILDKAFAQGADGIKIIDTNDDLLPAFLYFALKNKPIEPEGYKRHFAKLKQYKIPIPPLSKQKHIVRILNTAQSELALLKRLVETYRIQKRGLMQKLLIGKLRVKI